eukprot:scaffold138497_cov29-Prasinocladus_malaysianus.AAC.1
MFNQDSSSQTSLVDHQGKSCIALMNKACFPPTLSEYISHDSLIHCRLTNVTITCASELKRHALRLHGECHTSRLKHATPIANWVIGLGGEPLVLPELEGVEALPDLLACPEQPTTGLMPNSSTMAAEAPDTELDFLDCAVDTTDGMKWP